MPRCCGGLRRGSAHRQLQPDMRHPKGDSHPTPMASQHAKSKMKPRGMGLIAWSGQGCSMSRHSTAQPASAGHNSAAKPCTSPTQNIQPDVPSSRGFDHHAVASQQDAQPRVLCQLPATMPVAMQRQLCIHILLALVHRRRAPPSRILCNTWALLQLRAGVLELGGEEGMRRLVLIPSGNRGPFPRPGVICT